MSLTPIQPLNTEVDEPGESASHVNKELWSTGRRGGHSANQKQLLQIPVTGFCLGASYFWIFALSCFSPSSFLLFTFSWLLIHHSCAGRWVCFASSTHQCRQQQDSSERQEGIPLLLLRFAWEGAADHMETHFCRGRFHRGGLLCKAERPHDRATISGEGLAQCLPVQQSAHHPACVYPGWGLLHLPVQHTFRRAEELHCVPFHLW